MLWEFHVMRNYLATSLVLFFVGLLCCAQSPSAGFPPGTFQSRAALDAPGGAAPTVITLTDPNFTANGASWGRNNTGITSNFANDPSGNMIAAIVTNSGTVAFAQFDMPVFGTGIMTGGVTYSFTGWARKPIGGEGPSGANWLNIFIYDGGVEAYGQIFDTNSGALGSSSVSANAFLTSFTVTGPDAQGLYKFVLVGGFISNQTGALAYGQMETLSTGGGATTVGQNFIVSRWGQ